MKKLMILLLMLVGTVNAALPANVGANIAKVVGYDYYCGSYSTAGSLQMGVLVDALGGVQEISNDPEYLSEAIAIHQAFSELDTEVACTVLMLLLMEVDLYDTFF